MSDPKNDGGPVFPGFAVLGSDGSRYDLVNRGISQRSLLAGLAMVAYIQKIKGPIMVNVVASMAYAMADAMLKAEKEAVR